MSEIKRLLVLGLGDFGAAVARRLTANGSRVTGLDRDENAVAMVQDELTEAMVADVTDIESLRQLSFDQVDTVIVCLNQADSLLATLHCKELGAHHVIARAFNDNHKKLLLRLGADRVVCPEEQFAQRLADEATWPRTAHPLAIDPTLQAVEVTVPAAALGKKIELSRQYGLYALAVNDALAGDVDLSALSDQPLVLVVGTAESLEAFRQRVEEPPPQLVDDDV